MLYHLRPSYSEDSSEEVKERIFNQNFKELKFAKQDFDKNTNLIFKTGPRNTEVCNWVLETTNAIRGHFISAGRVFYRVHSRKVADYQVVTRCYKCQRFGHVSKYCKASQDICSQCSKEGHKVRDCSDKQKDPVCSNCTRAKRSAQKVKHSVLSNTFIGEKERLLVTYNDE